MQQAKRLALENNHPYCATENFHDNYSQIHRPLALTEEQKDQIVEHVTANSEHREMEADELQPKPSLPPGQYLYDAASPPRQRV